MHTHVRTRTHPSTHRHIHHTQVHRHTGTGQVAECLEEASARSFLNPPLPPSASLFGQPNFSQARVHRARARASGILRTRTWAAPVRAAARARVGRLRAVGRAGVWWAGVWWSWGITGARKQRAVRSTGELPPSCTPHILPTPSPAHSRAH
jgi:hypothetical protein